MFGKKGIIICGLLVFYLTCTHSASTPKSSEEPLQRLRKAHKQCAPQFVDDDHNNIGALMPLYGAYVRCMSTKMVLWTDKDGFSAKKVAEFFKEEGDYESEVIDVVNYCNQKHKQANLTEWADKAYNCGTDGRMGIWLADIMLNGK